MLFNSKDWIIIVPLISNSITFEYDQIIQSDLINIIFYKNERKRKEYIQYSNRMPKAFLFRKFELNFSISIITRNS